ncbi:YfhO family protein [Anaeromicropila herbilytica]|uniref:YfhO family protein n=1 Tax=Anaeromicropila herbilytica TaxID=2785025 RepID=A0A7R7ICP3_9FIRM|nr:YfhO family protein [Anaeromicropila herbilytica]BCN30081.1 hypothetical protein bsdtb5_13760 [Anaeromicropila herbilytica]
MKKTWFKNTYFIYTCSFLLLLPIIFMPFFMDGKTFVWKMDGINQHYPMFIYYGKLLRSLLTGNGFPMFDMNIGLGFDTIGTLQYYVLGDPIALFSVFATKENGVYLYCALILLRFYLLGISYIIFCKYWGKKGVSVLGGAFIYTFCGFSLYSGIRHPYFLNPMIYLPLIIIGLEQILRKKKPYLLIVIVFVSTISNFYFLFMLTVISVIYVIIRYFMRYRKTYDNVLKGFIYTGLKTGGPYLLGIAMGSFLFLPIIYAFMNNSRLGNGPQMPSGYLHYRKGYYLKLLQGVFAPGAITGYWSELSFCTITAVSVVALICNKKYRKLLFIFLLAFSALLVPYVGYFMNGFAYVANRWCFALALIVAFIFTETYENLFTLKIYERLLFLVGIGGYGIITFYYPAKDIVKNGFYCLLITAIVVLIYQLRWFADKKIIRDISFYLILLMMIGFHGFAFYSPKYYAYANEYLTKKEVDSVFNEGVLNLVSKIDDKDSRVFRVETCGDKCINESLYIGYNEVSGYYSLMTGNVAKYLDQLEVLTQKSAYRFDSLDNRTVLDSLASVKYIASTKRGAAPYGFRLINKGRYEGKNIYLYKNDYALPLGYAYDSYLLEKDYEKLTAIEKQNSMLYSIVLPKDNNMVAKADEDVSHGIIKRKVKIIPDENIKLTDNKIKVKKAGAKITLEFKQVPNSETYLIFHKLNLLRRYRTMATFKVKGDSNITKKVNVRSIYYGSYFGKENYLVNIGYEKKGESKITITFPEKKSFTYESIEVYCVNMDFYKEQVHRLIRNSLQNITIHNNTIQGDITLTGNRIMAISIPYSKGFSAYVDHKKVELLHGNIMNMALPLKKGSHHIVLKYKTPYFNIGCFISITAFVGFAFLIIWNKKRASGKRDC